MIRRVLNMQMGKTVDCVGRGPGALWEKSVISVKECNKEGNSNAGHAHQS